MTPQRILGWMLMLSPVGLTSCQYPTTLADHEGAPDIRVSDVVVHSTVSVADSPSRARISTGEASRALLPDQPIGDRLPMTLAGKSVGGAVLRPRRDVTPISVETPPQVPATESAGNAPALDAVGLEPELIPVPDFSGSSMTLADLESIAIQHNPSIRQASAVAHKAMGTRRQVGLKPNPTLSYIGQEIGDDGTYGQQGLQIEQTFVRGSKLGLNQRVADQEVEALLWQVESQRRRVLTDVRAQYYATLAAQERLKLTTDLMASSTQAADNARVLVENGQSPRADALQAEIQLTQIEVLQRQAEFQRQGNWKQLANLVGMPELTLTELDAPLDFAGVPREWQQTVQTVVYGNPLLQQATAEVERARLQIQRAQAQRIPNVEVQAGVIHIAQSDNVAANLQVGVPLPIHNRNQGNIDRACAEYNRARGNADRLRMSLEAQLASTFARYESAASRVQLYRDEIIPREQESVELIQLGYPAQFDFLRLWTARRSFYDARIQYLDALVELRQTEVLMDGLMLTGGLNSVDDTVIDDDMRDAALSGQ